MKAFSSLSSSFSELPRESSEVLIVQLKKKRREEKKAMRRILLCGFLIAIGVALFVERYLSSDLEKINYHIATLNSEIEKAMYTKKMTPENLVNKKAAILKKIKENQKKLAALFALLDKTASPICFSEIKREQQVMYFLGHTDSAWSLTDFLKTWNIAAIFPSVTVEQLQKNEMDQVEFRLRANEDQD